MASTYRSMVTDDGVSIGGVPAHALAERYGSPLYAYDAGILRERFREMRVGLPKKIGILYSVKANPNLAILSILKEEGAGVDVASRGELLAARRTGFQPDRILFGSPVKSAEEIGLALETGCYAINAESLLDARKIARVARERETACRIGLRVNPSFSVSGSMQSGGGSQKFGVDEEQAVGAVELLRKEGMEIRGIHVFSASGVLDARELAGHVKKVFALAEKIESGTGSRFDYLDVGSGIGVPYSENENGFDLGLFASLIEETVNAHSSWRLLMESGRFIVAECGAYLTRVVDVKESRGRRFVLTDGGINHFLRPSLVGANHPVFVANRPSGAPAASAADICGPLCTSRDCIGRGAALPEVSEGDLLAFMDAGAYGYSESMPFFLSHRVPAEVLVEEGKARLVRKSVTEEDMLAMQEVE